MLRECKSRPLRSDGAQVRADPDIFLGRYETSDSVYDLAWAESNETQVIVAGGDGSIKLYDTKAPENFPVASWQEHNREVYAVCWNLVTKDSFVSSSWDGTVKVVQSHHPAITPRSDVERKLRYNRSGLPSVLTLCLLFLRTPALIALRSHLGPLQ